jgi:hypothetical protein
MTKDEFMQNAVNPQAKEPDKWDYLKNIGTWSDEEIDAVRNPKPGLNMIDIFRRTSTKPEAPDEKQFKRNETVAAIGQGLGTLAEMFAAGKGARVQKRDTTSPVAGVNDRAEKIRQIYQNKLESYNQGEQSAMVRDEMIRQQRTDSKGQEMSRTWQNKIKSDETERNYQQKRKDSLEDKKAGIDYSTKKGIERTNATKTPKEKEVKLTPQQQVKINSQFQSLPIDFLKQKGYTEEITYTEPGEYKNLDKTIKKLVPRKNIPPEIMQAIIEEYGNVEPVQQTQSTPYKPSYQKKSIPGF